MGAVERSRILLGIGPKPWGKKWQLPGSREQSTWKTFLLALAGTIFDRRKSNSFGAVINQQPCAMHSSAARLPRNSCITLQKKKKKEKHKSGNAWIDAILSILPRGTRGSDSHSTGSMMVSFWGEIMLHAGKSLDQGTLL